MVEVVAEVVVFQSVRLRWPSLPSNNSYDLKAAPGSTFAKSYVPLTKLNCADTYIARQASNQENMKERAKGRMMMVSATKAIPSDQGTQIELWPSSHQWNMESIQRNKFSAELQRAVQP